MNDTQTYIPDTNDLKQNSKPVDTNTVNNTSQQNKTKKTDKKEDANTSHQNRPKKTDREEDTNNVRVYSPLDTQSPTSPKDDPIHFTPCKDNELFETHACREFNKYNVQVTDFTNNIINKAPIIDQNRNPKIILLDEDI